MGAGVVQKPDSGERRRRGRGRSRPMAEINVTPFVDVMLVLLIIFMVAAPLMTVGVPVELPETAANALPGEEEEPLTVTVTAEGLVMIQTSEVAREELVTKLRAIATERDSTRVFLRADGAVPYAQVMQVMGALNRGGFGNIGLVTDTGGPKLDEQDGEGRRVNTGHVISGAGHLGLIAFALFGGAFQSEPLPFEVTEVTAISAEEFAALTQGESIPEAVANVDTPEPPQEGEAPALTSEADSPPERSEPEVAETPPPDEVPEPVEPAPQADVSDEAPVMQPPQEDSAMMVPEVSPRPQV